MSKKVKILPAVSDLTLDDEMLQYDKVKGIEGWYENHGYCIVGEIEDRDFFMWTCYTLLKGPPGGGFYQTEGGLIHQTTFFALPQELRGHMLDNDYIAGDTSPQQYLKASELKIKRENDRVVLKVQNREYIARPPYWEIHGEHKGVDLDLIVHSICPGFWYLGTFENITETMSAGIDQYIQVEGTIAVGGKKYEVSGAGGLHEHVALPSWDQVNLVSQSRYLYFVGWSEDIQIFVFYMPGLNNFTGHVIVDGKAYDFHGPQQVLVDERETWADPRSSWLIGCKWQVRLISEEGVLDVIVANGGRAPHVNAFSNGYMVRYWNLAIGNGSFTLADGKTIPVKDMRIGIDRTWVFNALR